MQPPLRDGIFTLSIYIDTNYFEECEEIVDWPEWELYLLPTPDVHPLVVEAQLEEPGSGHMSSFSSISYSPGAAK